MSANKTEGSFEDRLVQIMRSVGHNTDTAMQIGVVTAPPPNPVITLRIGGLELDADDLLFPQYLTEHTRQVSGTGTMQSAGDPSHTHTYEVTEITYESPLKEGDEVIVLCDFERQTFLVVDKVVRY